MELINLSLLADGGRYTYGQIPLDFNSKLSRIISLIHYLCRCIKKVLISCGYNIDNRCVEPKPGNSGMTYNDSTAYADLVLNSVSETYLKTVTEYKPLDC